MHRRKSSSNCRTAKENHNQVQHVGLWNSPNQPMGQSVRLVHSPTAIDKACLCYICWCCRPNWIILKSSTLAINHMLVYQSSFYLLGWPRCGNSDFFFFFLMAKGGFPILWIGLIPLGPRWYNTSRLNIQLLKRRKPGIDIRASSSKRERNRGHRLTHWDLQLLTYPQTTHQFHVGFHTSYPLIKNSWEVGSINGSGQTFLSFRICCQPDK